MTAFGCLSLAICFLLGMPISDATQPNLRIVGGDSVTSKFRYPYMVSITNSKGSHTCGGVLIQSNVVISAAHCVPSAYSVQIGRYDLSAMNGDKRWDYEVLKIEEKIIHPLYDDETNLGDLVIFQLESSSEIGRIVTMQNSTTAISRSSEILGNNLTVIGWGATKVNGEMSDKLQEVVVHQVSNTECNSLFGRREIIKPSMICASLPGQDACQGDSGGPLLHLGDDPQGADDIVVGLVSFGIGCAHPEYPGVYTRVESYFDWIMRTMEDIEVPNLTTEENQSRNPDGFLSSPDVWRWFLAGSFVLVTTLLASILLYICREKFVEE